MALFPPLPAIPTAPQTGVDPRQTRTRKIVANINQAIGSQGAVVPVRGYHAAAVNVGVVQAALEKCLSRFSELLLEARWEEIRTWTSDFLSVWVQRCKELVIERHGSALHIKITAQDDLGYYQYAFDVFPHRETLS
jgi:hypothetical protein